MALETGSVWGRSRESGERTHDGTREAGVLIGIGPGDHAIRVVGCL
jgi:hypothetical protein